MDAGGMSEAQVISGWNDLVARVVAQPSETRSS
jgi:hypothetical protein